MVNRWLLRVKPFLTICNEFTQKVSSLKKGIIEQKRTVTLKEMELVHQLMARGQTRGRRSDEM
jgi:hypothetical protein